MNMPTFLEMVSIYFEKAIIDELNIDF